MEAHLSLVSAPTEVGESLTFEMALYAFDRLFGKDCDAIVLWIVPLISLMKDQVSNLNSRRTRAYFESEGKTSVLSSSGKSPQNPLVLFHYWSVREGNAQSKNGSRLVCAGKRQKWRTELPQGFARVSHSPFKWGRFLQGGDRSFQVVWRTDLQVDWNEH